MGVYANTVSVAQFIVTGSLPERDTFEWYSAKLASRAFRSIENSTDELSEGWTQVDHPDYAIFDVPSSFWRDNYLVFSLRRDQRRIPAALLKSHIKREESDFLTRYPHMKRPPKEKRDEIRELVRLRLLARCLPIPSMIDVVWDLKNGALTLFSLGNKAVERFEDIFRKTFEGLSLQAIHPFARAHMLLDGALLDSLEKANQANSDSAVALIRGNQWLGWDFMLWLLHRGLNGEGNFAVRRSGHFSKGETFSSWIDDRIALERGGAEGVLQKVTLSGSQDNYLEAISAVRGGKKITAATICMEKDENLWKLTLKGETFGFASFKCPQIRIERDDAIEETSEREAAFYERMYLLEQGLQLFDSLYLGFLEERLTEAWSGRARAIREWLEGIA